MKQVVINGGDTYGGLLTPYWTKKYLERKGLNIYVYNQEVGLEDKWEYELIEDKKRINDPAEIYNVYYLTKNVGSFLDENEWNNLKLIQKDIIPNHRLFKNREDKDLIAIAKEINNEDLIKVIEIPDDIKYKICEGDCSCSEWVEEDILIRTWY